MSEMIMPPPGGPGDGKPRPQASPDVPQPSTPTPDPNAAKAPEPQRPAEPAPAAPTTIPPMRLVNVPFSRINFAVYNPRKDLKPGDKEWKDIEASLQRFGFVQNLVWNERTGNLVGGHQRTKILKHHGYTEAICAVVNLDDADEKALNIALNRLGEGAWDKTRLAGLLSELRTKGQNIESLGFTVPDINKLLKRAPKKHKVDPDSKIPPVTQWSLSQTGDVYDLISADGSPQHRLIVGDATDLAVVDRLMQGQKAAIYFTDPPYGVGYTQGHKGAEPTWKPIENDALSRAALQAFLTPLFKNAHAHTTDTAAFYSFYAALQHIPFQLAMEEAGWAFTHQGIWKKPMIISRGDYHWAHKPILYGKKASQRRRWTGDRTQTTIFLDTEPDFRSMTKDELVAMLREMKEAATLIEQNQDKKGDLWHPCQKPIAHSIRALNNNTAAGDILLDTCGGSGSSLIGCEETNRHARIVEKDGPWADAIVKRYFRVYDLVSVLRNGQEVTLADFEPPKA